MSDFTRFTPDGEELATVDVKRLNLWKVKTGASVSHIDFDESIVDVAFNSAKTHMIVTTLKNFHLWDMRTGQRVGPPLARNQPAPTVFPPTEERGVAAFTPKGDKFMVRSNKNAFDLRFTADATLVRTLTSPSEGDVYRLTFSRDGSSVILSEFLRSTTIWEVEPAPVRGDPERITLAVQVQTGEELNEDGMARRLDVEELKRRSEQLDKLGGSPWGR